MSFCEVVSCTMVFLSLIVALVGLVGNATVLWFLGFQMRRNAFSVYILNLAGSIRHHRFQRKTLKLFLQRAMQDTPEEEECGEMGSSGRSREIKTVWKGLRAALIRHKL
uniref:Uncharacterized protein n=1 Tax=Mus spicilegus TaxID=10103 RepID=A0A8C6N3D8_MUSSI